MHTNSSFHPTHIHMNNNHTKYLVPIPPLKKKTPNPPNSATYPLQKNPKRNLKNIPTQHLGRDRSTRAIDKCREREHKAKGESTRRGLMSLSSRESCLPRFIKTVKRLGTSPSVPSRPRALALSLYVYTRARIPGLIARKN